MARVVRAALNEANRHKLAGLRSFSIQLERRDLGLLDTLDVTASLVVEELQSAGFSVTGVSIPDWAQIAFIQVEVPDRGPWVTTAAPAVDQGAVEFARSVDRIRRASEQQKGEFDERHNT